MLFFIATAILGVSISYSSIYLFHVALFSLCVYFISSVIKNDLSITKPVLPTKYHKFFYIMFWWYLLTIVWSIDKAVSLQYMVYIFCGVTIAITIIYFSANIEKQNKVFKVVSIVFFIEIFFCLLESLTSFRLPVSAYSKYLSFFGRENVLENFSAKTFTPTGFEWNPNTLAAVLNITLPFFLLHKRMLVKLAGSSIILFLIVATGSRGNFVAATLILFCFIYFLNKRRALILGFLLPVLGFLGFLLVNPLLKVSSNPKIRAAYDSFNTLKIYFTSYEGRDDSIGVRRMLIENGLNGLKTSNGLGIGGGASKLIVSNGIPWLPETYPMHNFWIELLVEGGILFFAIFVLWYFKVLLDLYKISISKITTVRLRYFSSASLLAMIGFSVGAVSASSTIYVLPMWVLFGFAIATINNHKRTLLNNKEATA